MSEFPNCKITVLKTHYDRDLDEKYRRDDVHRGPCEYFQEGQEFIVNYLGDKPADFQCNWAWDDIQKVLLTLMQNGDFGIWMKDKNSFVTCCTDGITPVVFKVERLAE